MSKLPRPFRIILRVLLVLSLIALSLGAVGGAMWLSDAVHERTYVEKEIPDYNPTKPIPAEALKEDFAITRGAIEDEHGDPYIYTPKEELSAMFDAAYAQLNKPMSEIEFVKLTGPIIHAVHDGHTNLSLPEVFGDSYVYEVPIFPAVSYLEKDRVLVWNDGTSQGSLPRGSEIISIDGEPVNALVQRITDLFVSTDGYTSAAARQELQGEEDLRSRFATYLAYLKNFPETYDVTFRAPAGTERTAQVRGEQVRDIFDTIQERYPPSVTDADELGTHEEDEAVTRLHWEGDVPVLTIDSFNDGSFDEYAAALERAFTKIQERNASDLVIDLRDNGGGAPGRGWLLLKYFGKVDIPVLSRLEVRAFQSRYARYSSSSPWKDRMSHLLYQLLFTERTEGGIWVGRDVTLTTAVTSPFPPYEDLPEITPSPFEGHTFLLLSGQTFSSGSEFASLAKTYLESLTVVGQETMGTSTALVTELFTNLILPNTRLELRVPLARLDYVGTEGRERGRGVLPDVEVWPTFEDASEDRDRVMERALELIKDEPPE